MGPLISGKSRLVKYYNLARHIWGHNRYAKKSLRFLLPKCRGLSLPSVVDSPWHWWGIRIQSTRCTPLKTTLPETNSKSPRKWMVGRWFISYNGPAFQGRCWLLGRVNHVLLEHVGGHSFHILLIQLSDEETSIWLNLAHCNSAKILWNQPSNARTNAFPSGLGSIMIFLQAMRNLSNSKSYPRIHRTPMKLFGIYSAKV